MNRTIAAGENISLTVAQNVPAEAVTGTYHLAVATGVFPTASFIDNIDFEKQSDALRGPVTGKKGWDHEMEIVSELKRVKSASNDYSLKLTSFPNPFQSFTNIHFELAHSGPVKIEIYDILGRVLSTPVDGYLTAGVHEIRWAAKELPTGVYILMMETDSARRSKNMLLVR